ncbi:hypothetical protein A6A28_17095 [Streptomyces sp. CB03578]|uniref:electron transport complex subunit RsxC n=1 Tax=Streptomyces sp. CB03578 TaxID=1718987 RepID=UPI00093EC15A|nr:electron transport complex subunit RsxC [Streptomyces sp. CB03578]OKI26678.1 hypothetical protein A6A28_17095 [Streptomyces sp. CB03578]
MDLDSVAAELYERVPSEFTAARDAHVAKARKAGDRPLATAIGALRKPTVAAWAAGLLARRRPKEAQGLVQLGEALRTAHRTLDAERLRKLSHDQHVVIGELARTARALAAEAGQMVSEPVQHEVEQILHAVLADADVAAQWAAGRLTKAPDVVSGFTGLEPLTGTVPPRRAQQAPAAGFTADQTRPPEPDAGKRASQAHRERVDAARAELAEAQSQAERLEAAQAAAQELADQEAVTVAKAVADVQAAKERLETARAASTHATAGLREASRAVAKARAGAKTAARKVEKLTSSQH